jgi:hypothetical protein
LQSGKQKSRAIAAFLGKSGCCQQNDVTIDRDVAGTTQHKMSSPAKAGDPPLEPQLKRWIARLRGQ